MDQREVKLRINETRLGGYEKRQTQYRFCEEPYKPKNKTWTKKFN